MSVKDKLIGAITAMDETEALRLWAEIKRHAGFELTQDELEALWSAVPEEEPDEIDLQMLQEIENNPECHEIATEEETMAVFGCN